MAHLLHLICLFAQCECLSRKERQKKAKEREDKEDNSAMLLPLQSLTASATKRGCSKDDFTLEQLCAPVIQGGKKTAVVHCKHCNKKISYL
eukprot:57614-Ditylum_brightwellii.AAC.1